jgi:hypothetical protein
MSGGHISVGAKPRSYQVTPEILRRRRATQHPPVRRVVDRKSMSQPVASPRTYRPRRTPPPDPLTLSLRNASPPSTLHGIVQQFVWRR